MLTRNLRPAHVRFAPARPRFLAGILVLLTSVFPVVAAESLVELATGTASIGLDTRGQLAGIKALGTGRDYLAPGQPAPLLSLRFAGRLHAPSRAAWDATKQEVTLQFDTPNPPATVRVRAVAKPTHVVFEVLAVEPARDLELVLWGPYPTTIRAIIGETVGVVRDSEFAVGIQALEARTLGGYPHAENDAEGESSEDDVGPYADLPPELLKGQHFRTDTARRTAFGSVLQAYCRQRDRDRVIANWGHPQYLAPAFPDGGVVGSRIALFGVPAPRALETIGAIELAEGLPHPLLDGVWGKVSPEATASYLIVDFSEATVDRALEMTRRAGLKYLYHSSPFATWGHFRLKPDLFPNGWDGLRACVEKGRRVGIRIGFHTLSNFITPNDPYVTPKPDPRLAKIGASTLAEDLDAARKEIPVADTNYFARKSALNAVVIGDELVRFASVSAGPPWRLLGCERGAWGTQAASHARGTAIARLLDHDYQVFLSDPALSPEIARRIAELFNHTGTLQLSFDGLEGNWSTGLGKYGCALFTQAWYEALDPALRGRVINDASLTGHFSWHINTRMNWGEPWYGGFRESQTLYRFKNQVYFERNFLPRMLGWFALRSDTSLEDAEWLLARAAGFDAGFTLATSLASTAQLEADPLSADTARRFGATTAILESIRQWETARMARAFPPAVRAALRDNQREFHLQPAGTNQWDLQEAHLERFTHDAAQPVSPEFAFRNPFAAQPLAWTLRSTNREPMSQVTLELDGTAVVDLGEAAIPAGGSLRYTGGPEAVITDAAWKEQRRLPVQSAVTRLEPGTHRVRIRSQARPGFGLKLELRTLGPAQRLEAGAGRAP